MIEWMTGLAGLTGYLVLFSILYISGAGVPIPEELPLVIGGILVAERSISVWVFGLTIAAALVLGDLTAYALGRLYGRRLARVWPFSWVLTEERFNLVRTRVRNHEGKAIFFGRFVTGIRLVTYIVCGMAHVPVLKFALIDAIAIAIYAPIPVYIGYLMGDVNRAVNMARKVDLLIAAILVAALTIAYFYWRSHQRRSALSRPLELPPANDPVEPPL